MPMGDHSPYSHGLNIWFKSDTVRRNYISVTRRGSRFKQVTFQATSTEDTVQST